MTTNQARKWIVLFAFYIVGTQFAFLIAAPSIGFPLSYPQNIEILQIVLPIFLGYLGSASHFIFANRPDVTPVNNEILGIIVKGAIIVYAVATIATFGAFWYSNRSGAPPGGMTKENLATAVSIALGLLAVTTSILTSYLFAQREDAAPIPASPPHD